MKPSVLVGLVSLLSFIGGLAVNSSSHAEIAPSNQDARAAQAAFTPTPGSQQAEFPKLIEDKYVTKFNGPRLRLGCDTGVVSEDVPSAVNSAKVSALDDGGLLVSPGDTLYRLDRQSHVLWRYYTAQKIFDYAYVESTNLIYGTAGDTYCSSLTPQMERNSEANHEMAVRGMA